MVKRAMGIAVMAVLTVFFMSACGGGSDDYTEYKAAYNKITANGGLDADIDATVTMDGETNAYYGNFKLDSVNNNLYYEMSANGQTTTQFSDGSYLYTERGNEKVKYALDGSTKPTDTPSQDSEDKAPQKDAPEFSTSEFLNQFASFLDAGKIKELGLLDPIDKIAVTKTTKDGDTYTLEVSESITKQFLNTMIQEQAGDDSVKIEDLENFSYTATKSGDYISKVVYSGDTTVTVPASLMSNGKEKEYTLSFKIQISFNNPGSEVTITLPDAKDYHEVTNL